MRRLAHAPDLVELVDVDDPAVGLGHVPPGRAHEISDERIDAVSLVADFRERRRAGEADGRGCVRQCEIVVVHGHRKIALRAILADHKPIKVRNHFPRRR